MSPRSAGDFAAALAPHFQLEDLEQSSAIVFGLWADLSLAYCNPAWKIFAGCNGGEPRLASADCIGANYLEAIAEPLRPFYRALLARASEPGESLHPVSHLYECSSPTLFRKFSMHVYALPGRAGFVVVNALVVETSHDAAERPPQEPAHHRYASANGVILQCAHCRLVQRVAEPMQWDWVPDWVASSPAEISHGICQVCAEYFYPQHAA